MCVAPDVQHFSVNQMLKISERRLANETFQVLENGRSENRGSDATRSNDRYERWSGGEHGVKRVHAPPLFMIHAAAIGAIVHPSSSRVLQPRNYNS